MGQFLFSGIYHALSKSLELPKDSKISAQDSILVNIFASCFCNLHLHLSPLLPL
jgi:hypothetical protein